MLTNTQIKNLKPESKAKRYYDEKGLYLEVAPKGGKYWRLKYRIDNKEKRFSIGVYPEVSLAEARNQRDEARKQIAQGIDPSQAKQQKKEKDAGKDSFQFVAQEWLARQDDKASTTIDKAKWLLQFAIDAFGSEPIDKISAIMVLRVCRKEEDKGHLETAQRIKTKCSQVFRYAVATERLERDPTPDLRGALKAPQIQHRAAVTDIRKIPELLKDISQYNGDFNTIFAFRLAPLVFIRPGEMRGALWSDIDFEAAEWRYTPPKTRNKTKLMLIVPLARQTLEILKQLHAINGHTPYVFFSEKAKKHKVMSENTVNQALRRMGYSSEEMCGHGFRALAYTTLKGQLKYPDDMIELQLGHQIKNIHGMAYDRWTYLDERREMMQRWADYLDELRGGQIVAFPKAAG